jgi:hypothetical protein
VHGSGAADVSTTALWFLDVLLLLAGAVWVGGLVTVAVVARVARRELDGATRVAFFWALGRAHGVLGGAALAFALAAGATLLAQRDWDGMALAAAATGALLAVVTVAGVRQARTMTSLRQHALLAPTDVALAARVRRGARRASVLRATIAVLTLALVALGGALAG